MRGLVAVVFLVEGISKFGASRLWVRVFGGIGIGEWFRYFTAVVEIAGAMLILIPRATMPATVLLICTLIGAFLVHVFIIGIQPATGLVAVLVGIILLIARRWQAASGRPPAPH